MRISDWSSDVCSSDLKRHRLAPQGVNDMMIIDDMAMLAGAIGPASLQGHEQRAADKDIKTIIVKPHPQPLADQPGRYGVEDLPQRRSEEHTSELQSLLRISYAVFCLKKKKTCQQYPHIQ